MNYNAMLDWLDGKRIVLLNESYAKNLLDKNGPLDFGFKRTVYSKSEDIRAALKQVMEEKFLQQVLYSSTELEREVFLDITTYDSDVDEAYDAIAMELVIFEQGDTGQFVSGFSLDYDPSKKEFVFENFITDSDMIVKEVRESIYGI